MWVMLECIYTISHILMWNQGLENSNKNMFSELKYLMCIKSKVHVNYKKKKLLLFKHKSIDRIRKTSSVTKMSAWRIKFSCCHFLFVNQILPALTELLTLRIAQVSIQIPRESPAARGMQLQRLFTILLFPQNT